MSMRAALITGAMLIAMGLACDGRDRSSSANVCDADCEVDDRNRTGDLSDAGPHGIDGGYPNECGGEALMKAPLHAPCRVLTDTCSARGTWECDGRETLICRSRGNGQGEFCDGQDNDCDRLVDENDICLDMLLQTFRSPK
jgi:hypothetical protein